MSSSSNPLSSSFFVSASGFNEAGEGGGAEEEMGGEGGDSFSGVGWVVGDGMRDDGRVVVERKYWKPWQPPDSTWIRRARWGLESCDIISANLCIHRSY